LTKQLTNQKMVKEVARLIGENELTAKTIANIIDMAV
jgi:rRNA processing protein Krr1/Pno1